VARSARRHEHLTDRRRRRCRVCAAAAGLPAAIAALLLWSGRAPTLGQAGDLGVTISLLVEQGRMTAKEPLLARITLARQGNAPTSVPVHYSPESYLSLEVLDAHGAVLASTPKPDRGGVIDGPGTDEMVPTREGKPDTWIVSGLYCFERPGRYTIRLRVLPPREGLLALCEATAPLEVTPFDAQRLDARCAELLEPCWKHSGFGDLEMGCRTKALYSVRDDVALPYVDWMAREWSSRYACRAIERIGTPRAQRLLQSLQRRTDSVGEAARKLPEQQDITMWDVECP